MAITENTYTGNGTSVLFPFTFPYLDSADVKVTLNGTLTTAYTFANATTIQFTSAPAAGISIRIYRETANDEASATFFPGSSIKASDLNNNFIQILYAVQEVVSRYISKAGGIMTGILNMGGFRITNVGTPASDADSATKKYVDDRYGQLSVPGVTRWRKTATAGQTTFSGSGEYGGTLAYSASRETVYVNGALQQRNVDYTADNGTSIVFTPALILGDVVEVHCVNNAAGITTDQASGVYWTQSGTGAVTRTVDSKLKDVVSVKDFGAVGDGVANDTAAIQAAFNWFAARQNEGIPSKYGHIHFPQGIYRLTSFINVYGYISITGVGTGYIAGSVLRQDTANTDIFRFYANQIDNVGLGICIDGVIFEHQDGDGNNTGTGAALRFPRINPATGAAMGSNSHYIRNCRYGALYRFGTFVSMDVCNDVEISGCIIDVCRGSEAVKIGSRSLPGSCSDVRIIDNNFFSCNTGIHIANAKAVTICGNNFAIQEVVGGAAIKLRSDDATITEGLINGVTITGNSFWAQQNCLHVDGSATNIIYANNVHTDCIDYPIKTFGGTSIKRHKITGNTFKLASAFNEGGVVGTYGNAEAVINFTGGGVMTTSDFTDNRVDANGLNGVTKFFNDQSTTGWLGAGNTIRNNSIENNTSIKGSHYSFVPTSAKELVVIDERTYTVVPTSQEVFNFQTAGFAVGDSVSFDIDYEVICTKTGTNIGTRIGRVSVAVARLELSGAAAAKGIVTSVFTIGDDYNGAGGTNIPTVTFTLRYSPNPAVLATVTWGLVSDSTVVRCKAFNFRSTDSVQIKSA
jgi:hypothetical protein